MTAAVAPEVPAVHVGSLVHPDGERCVEVWVDELAAVWLTSPDAEPTVIADRHDVDELLGLLVEQAQPHLAADLAAAVASARLSGPQRPGPHPDCPGDAHASFTGRKRCVTATQHRSPDAEP